MSSSGRKSYSPGGKQHGISHQSDADRAQRKVEGLGTWNPNIGKTGDELAAPWNEMNPDDQVD
ncbi:MAG: hypothetical protein ACOYYU_12840 [Chloroflexota bacterium]